MKSRDYVITHRRRKSILESIEIILDGNLSSDNKLIVIKDLINGCKSDITTPNLQSNKGELNNKS